MGVCSDSYDAHCMTYISGNGEKLLHDFRRSDIPCQLSLYNAGTMKPKPYKQQISD
jgi:hypothetical protein